MLTFIQNGTVEVKTYIKRMRNFRELIFFCHSDYLHKIFILLCVTVTVSDKVISEINVKQK